MGTSGSSGLVAALSASELRGAGGRVGFLPRSPEPRRLPRTAVLCPQPSGPFAMASLVALVWNLLKWVWEGGGEGAFQAAFFPRHPEPSLAVLPRRGRNSRAGGGGRRRLGPRLRVCAQCVPLSDTRALF